MNSLWSGVGTVASTPSKHPSSKILIYRLDNYGCTNPHGGYHRGAEYCPFIYYSITTSKKTWWWHIWPNLMDDVCLLSVEASIQWETPQVNLNAQNNGDGNILNSAMARSYSIKHWKSEIEETQHKLEGTYGVNLCVKVNVYEQCHDNIYTTQLLCLSGAWDSVWKGTVLKRHKEYNGMTKVFWYLRAKSRTE